MSWWRWRARSPLGHGAARPLGCSRPAGPVGGVGVRREAAARQLAQLAPVGAQQVEHLGRGADEGLGATCRVQHLQAVHRRGGQVNVGPQQWDVVRVEAARDCGMRLDRPGVTAGPDGCGRPGRPSGRGCCSARSDQHACCRRAGSDSPVGSRLLAGGRSPDGGSGARGRGGDTCERGGPDVRGLHRAKLDMATFRSASLAGSKGLDQVTAAQADQRLPCLVRHWLWAA